LLYKVITIILEIKTSKWNKVTIGTGGCVNHGSDITWNLFTNSIKTK